MSHRFIPLHILGLAVGSLLLTVACSQTRVPQRPGRSEVLPNLNGIRASQIAYHSVNGRYVKVEQPVPRGKEAVDIKQVIWPDGTPFDDLSWRPTGTVAGTYWIVLENGGEGFVAHALIDADGDGVLAHYTAARHEEAKPITADGVF